MVCKRKRNGDGAAGEESAREYEKRREENIKANMEKMKILGLASLSLELNAQSKLKKTSKRNATSNGKARTLPPVSQPPRRSSRLQNVAPVNYSEKLPRNNSSNDEIVIRIEEGSQPEIYTEEQEKLLGHCKESWTLFKDGYDSEGERIYDQVKEKTCHQCRQKTLGLRTHCCKCNLVQGQLCGDCLYTRYGENVIEANQNPNWICPACRGICNCSICRKQKGWVPTGNIYKQVAKLGYKSVAHYLIQTRRAQAKTKNVVGTEGALLSAAAGGQPSLRNGSTGRDGGSNKSPKFEEEEKEVCCSDSKHMVDMID